MKSKQDRSESVVAVDLGSNSFHLLEACYEGGRLRPILARKEKVQLALGMNDGFLSATAIDRGLAVLEGFAAFTKQRRVNSVRVVGTQALRMATNSVDFCDSAAAILGHSIELISGDEEAELVYNAVSRLVINGSTQPGRMLVVDIGGGSTELAAGGEHGTTQTCSLPLGCVSMLDYYPHSTIEQSFFDATYNVARQQFDRVAEDFGTLTRVVGCSGTLTSIESVLIAAGLSSSGIRRSCLPALKATLLSFGTIADIQFDGLSAERRGVFATGLAIAMALFDSFEIEHMELSPVALREAVALEMLTPHRSQS